MTLSRESELSSESESESEPESESGPGSGYDIGVQSVVYKSLSLEELLTELESIGVEYLELWGHHLSPADDAARIDEAVTAIEEADVTVCGYGVIDLEVAGDAGEHFAFADELGVEYVTVNYPPDSDEITEELIDHAEAFEIDVAIHNYSTVHHEDLTQVFSSVEDVKRILERHAHPQLGVCIDTGHFLVMEETPDDVIPDLGEHVVAVHLKDTSEAEIEDIPGAGQLDLPHVLSLFDEHTDLETPLIVEYELPAERATAALEDAVANIQTALSR